MANQVFGVEELDVGDGLLVASEDVESRLGVSQVVVVNAVISGTKRQMVATEITH